MNSLLHCFVNSRRVWALLGFCLAVPLLARGSQAGQLSPEHRKWLEEEVVYIITDREEEVFLAIDTYEGRERFIETFWKRRDPSRATPENEFRDEHYRRIEFANQTFSKQTLRPGWKTDQGRMYIILGRPRDRNRYEAYHDIVYTEVWFYQGEVGKGLPSFFYLLFFKQHDVGEYRLYSPTIDGPLSLIRGTPGFSNDSAAAIQILLDVSTDLAHASLSLDTSDPPDFLTGRPSLGADMVIGRIVDSPKRAVRTDYADAWLRYGKKVTAEYSFNFMPSRSYFAVLAGPQGAPFLHYSIELNPTDFVLETDKIKYYTTLDVSLEVTDGEGNRVVTHDKAIYIELTESQIQQFNLLPFAYQDDFPLVPGQYTVSVILRNRVDKHFTVAERNLRVDPIPPDRPGLSDMILGFRSEQTDDDAKEGELRTFQIGKARVHPAADGTFTLGESIYVFTQVLGAAPVDSLRLALLDTDEEILQERSIRVADLPGGVVNETFELTDMVGGRYQIRGELVDSGGKVLAERSAPLQVSPRTAIARPWVHRRSFDTSIPGLLALAVGEQFLALKRYEPAQRALEMAVAADNADLPQARWRLAGIYIGWKDSDRALQLLLPIEDKFANQYEVVAGLGFAFYFKDDFARAVDYLERAVTIRPPGTSLLNALGDCHQRLGDHDRARDLLQRSLELNPDQEPIKKQLASITASAAKN